MSTSPTRYYASRPSSRQASRSPTSSSRPTSPPNAAEVRSQAIAKLKRAASLPRQANGRRPTLGAILGEDSASAQTASASSSRQPSSTRQFDTSPSPHIPASSSPSLGPLDDQEVLSPSPINAHFDHAQLYPGVAGSSSTGMQRSASASSSYHVPTPPYGQSIGSPYYPSPVGSSSAPDWAAMQLAQSYLPSLSPAGFGAPPQMMGRNTPSPLPTLGEIATLQRSNSAAARAKAMSKLTGGRDTPDVPDVTLAQGRPGLQRADSLGTARIFHAAVARPPPDQAPGGSMQDEPASRPRLQRSFTVSSSNMGEERRSAVGRRMVERLAERRAARGREEAEVRRLWEERKGLQEPEPEQEPAQEHEEEERMTENGTGAGVVHDAFEDAPLEDKQVETDKPAAEPNGMLQAPERPPSGGTVRSAQEPFEYESHLRRSLSSRTARGAVGTVPEATTIPTIVTPLDTIPADHVEHLHDSQFRDGNPSIHQQLAAEPGPPQPTFSTPTKPSSHTSVSTSNTQSPGDSTLSGIGSMMFVMGRGSSAGGAGVGRQDEVWPTEVGDNSGSDWGTPAKDLHQPTFDDSPFARSPLGARNDQMPQALSLPSVHSDDDVTPPGMSARSSVMSWEEVGGAADREVPSDQRYHKKSGSISAKIGRNIRTAMRKRSASRSSVTSSPPTSPKIGLSKWGSRRESESSATPSSANNRSPNLQQGEQLRQQPSISSLGPSVQGYEGSSAANSMLLQHQLSSDQPVSAGWLPRADLSDPRVHNSKLSPFPGIVHLERRSTNEAAQLGPPQLLHQLSDSAVPSQQRVSSPTKESIYSLPLPSQLPPDESRRASQDSSGKRSWLAKTFGAATSPQSSTSASRKSSVAEIFGGEGSARQSRRPSGSADSHSGHALSGREDDPFAGPPPPPTAPSTHPLKSPRHRSASPSVSIVPEVSEEGSRLTRFTNAKGDHTPTLEKTEEEAFAIAKVARHHNGHAPEQDGEPDVLVSEKSLQVLNRMDDLLALAPEDPKRPDILDDPPRKLLAATQILQVVNIHTAKDRFLFLFNDLLVITKPLIPAGALAATLDMKFLVKSVVPLDELHVSGHEDDSAREPERHAVVQRFIAQFAKDPVSACRYLVDRSNPKVDAATLASLIFKTPELDRAQIGNLLAGNDKLAKAFVDRFHFTGMPIYDALRMFILSIRFPNDSTRGDELLRVFAARYFEANKATLGFDRNMTHELVAAMMQLNDTLHGMYGYSLRNPAVTMEVFVHTWRSRDHSALVPTELLERIWDSLSVHRLDQSLSAKNESERGRPVEVSPKRLPAKMSYMAWSEVITIRIPESDSDFKVKLWGEGLEFQPDVLQFSDGREQGFKVRGTSLGTKTILFDRIGSNAPLYASLGNARTFSIERAFMKHTFHVSFTSHTASRRKYCFSVADAETRAKWGRLLVRQIAATKAAKQLAGYSGTAEKVRAAAEAVALQVLRDAVIPSDSATATETATDGGEKKNMRSGSVSVAYLSTLGRNEHDLGPLQGTKPVLAGAKESGLVEIQSGKELVLLCRQNSLLPGLLELLQAGAGAGGPEQQAPQGDMAAEVARGRSLRGGRV